MKTCSLSSILKKLLGLLLFLLPWQTIWIIQERFLNGVKWQYGTQGFYATEGLLWVAVVLFIFWWWKKIRLKVKSRKFKVRLSKDRMFLLFCFAFIVYSLLSTVWALDAATAYQHAFYILEAFLLFFMLYLGPLDWKIAARWFVAGAVVQSVLGLWQFFAQTTFDFKWLGLAGHPVAEPGTSIVDGEGIGRVLRAYGAFNHPNVFGGYLVVSLIMTGCLFFNEKIERLKDVRLKLRLGLAFYVLLSTLQLSALFFTFSRSAWLAFGIIFISCIIYLLFKKKVFSLQSSVFSLYFVVIVVIVILSILYFPIIKTRFMAQSVHEIQSTSERIDGYSDAWCIFKEHPWLGVGSGNYTLAAHEINPTLPGWEYQPVHLVPLLIFVELGVVGMLLFLAIIVSLIIYHLSCITSNKKYKVKSITFFLLLVPYCVLLIFDHYFFSSYVGLLLSAVYISFILRLSTLFPHVAHRKK